MAEAEVTVARANHPDQVYAYRVASGGSAVVYATDTEHYRCVDPRLVALARGADVAARGGGRARDAAETMLAAAADCYGIAYGCDGALAVPAGARLPRRVVDVLARAAGDVPSEASKGARHVAA